MFFRHANDTKKGGEMDRLGSHPDHPAHRSPPFVFHPSKTPMDSHESNTPNHHANTSIHHRTPRTGGFAGPVDHIRDMIGKEGSEQIEHEKKEQRERVTAEASKEAQKRRAELERKQQEKERREYLDKIQRQRDAHRGGGGGAGSGNAGKKATIASTMQKKKGQKKALMGVSVLAGGAAFGFLIYMVYKHRATLAAGGSEAAKRLGPVISRLLPAAVLGVLSLVLGPEALIGSVPLGLIFGPEIMGGLGGLIGGGMEGGAVAQAAQVASVASQFKAQPMVAQ